MAEIVGLISSVITVSQVAGQVSSSVFKLKRLWNEVRDVPDSINALMTQLELLNSVLLEMETQLPLNPSIVQTDRLAMLSLEHSRRALQNLEKLVNDLHQQISATKLLKRGVLCVKVVLKKELIRAFQERLQNALQLFSLAQQTHLV